LGYGAGSFAPGRCSDRLRCAEGDSSTEPYIAGHNALLAHAAAVKLYRSQFQPTQGGYIGIVLNLDWAEPLTGSPEDIAAAQRRNEFQLAWFGDPIFFGQYPQSMINLVGARLPVFSASEVRLINGSVDFLGLNHYSTKYYSPCNQSSDKSEFTSLGWITDQCTTESKYDLEGNLIGAQADSTWLNVVPWGINRVLMWTSQRYGNPGILVTENGVDVPGESKMSIESLLNDTFRYFMWGTLMLSAYDIVIFD
jgi:beta-glucosidase